ncbi:type II toxin-antitoxin system RelE/ParE family toxin [Thermodesulfobacteriota bacterium]
MNYSFHPSAQFELSGSIDYYEDCQSGLGEAFAIEIFSAIQRIIEFPKAWPKFSKNTRRCLVKRFPYGVIYQQLDTEILIISVMPLSRKPGYWKERVRSS